MSGTNVLKKNDDTAVEAPLLADGCPNDEERAEVADKPHSGIRRAYKWLVGHLMFVIISLLLLG